MKVQRYGQAAILSPEELRLLFDEGFETSRDRALFGICFYTACRISEARYLRKDDISDKYILFRRCNTKGKLDSRETRMTEPLRKILDDYYVEGAYMFPGMKTECEFLSRATSDRILRAACEKVGLQGVSTHSFRRTALTTMHNNGVPLRAIQKISGHRRLDQLVRYLEVTDEQLYQAALTLNF